MTLYQAPGYDVIRDFAAITNIVAYPLVLVVHPSVAARSVAELEGWAGSIRASSLMPRPAAVVARISRLSCFPRRRACR